MLWLLKKTHLTETVFEHAKHMLKLMGKKYLQFYADIFCLSKIVSEYDQEIPQSQTAESPMALRRGATQQLPDIKKTN